jgi:hypothetical protein
MTPDHEILFKGYQIAIAEERMRFTARISRKGEMIRHDGRSSEIWASASCGSFDHAVATAMRAINTGQVE